MTDYVKAYDQAIKKQLKSGQVNQEILDNHRLQISYLQHERLIHLMVMSLVSLFLFGSFIVMLFKVSFVLILIFCIFFVLEIFYVWHYYFLENTVQSWYNLDKQLREIMSRQ